MPIGGAVTRRQALLLLALAATWGGSYALTKVLLDHGMPWAWVSAARLAIGAATVTAIARRVVGRDAARASWPRTAVIGALSAGLSLPMIALGQRWVATGLAGVIVGASPLFTAAVARVAVPDARLGRAGAAGLGLGFAGVVLLFAADLSGSSSILLGGLAILVAPVGYGIGAVLSQRWAAGVSPLAQTAANLTWAAGIALLLALAATAAGEGGPALHGAGAWAALLVLGAIGTGVAFAVFFGLIADVGPSRAMLVTYVAPVFSLLYGALLLDEPITAAAVAGIALIVLGVVITTRPARTSARGPAT